MTEEQVKVNIFFLYSRKDKELRDRLEIHLHSLKRRNYIAPWHDGEIFPGQYWEREITNYLIQADIILVLVSVDFIASDYCYEIEMTKALDRHENEEALVIPIILNDCDWKHTRLGNIQVLPKNGNPIVGGTWKDSEAGLRNAAKSITQIVLERLEKKEKNRKKLAEIIIGLEAKISLQTDEIDRLLELKKLLESRAGEFSEQVEKLGRNLKKQEKKNLEIEEDREQIKYTSIELYKEKSILVEELKLKERKIESLSEIIKKNSKEYKREINKLKKAVLALETDEIPEPQLISSKLHKIPIGLELQIKELKDEIQKLHNQKAYLKQNQWLKQENKDLLNENKGLKIKNKKLESSYQIEKKKKSSKIEELEETVSRLKKHNLIHPKKQK